MKVLITIYSGSKYDSKSEVVSEATYTNVRRFEIIPHSGRALDLEKRLDSIDENHRYLMLHLEDGTTATFRDTHTDIYSL